VEITETVKIPPRVKKMVVGKIKFPKYHETPNLVCIDPAQMPYEGVLAARGLSPVLSAGDRSSVAQMTSRRGRTSQLTIPDRADHVHVMLANFSEEEIVIPKATVVGVAEEISPTLVAAINDDARPADKRNGRTHCDIDSVEDEAKFCDYLREVLGHLPEHERAVMEPVLRK